MRRSPPPIRWATGLLALALASLTQLPAQEQQTDAQPQRPNLIWISVEDMSPWLGCYGDDTVPTPHIDRLAREGIRYANAFATTPVCAPSRSTLITGMYATTIGSMHMRTGSPSKASLAKNPDAYAGIPNYEAVPPAEVRCFPELLRAAGYYCTNRSKTDYQFKAPGTVWDASGGKAHWRNRPDPDQPFFAVFNLTVTHESGTFRKKKRQERVTDPEQVPIPPYYPDTERVRDDIARTYDNIAAMDRQVGRLLDELEEAGELEKSVIVFFSDHGVGLPRGKRCVYDSGTRVPLIVRLPSGLAAGSVEDRVVSFVDFAPSALSICGVEPPNWMQGRAFAGPFVAEGTGFSFQHADRMDSVRDRTRAVTDGRYRYIRNFDTERPRLYSVPYADGIPMMADIKALGSAIPATDAQWQMIGKTKPREEFYDSSADPHEIVNRIDDPTQRERIARLRKALDEWIEQTGDLGMLPEGEMVRTRLWDGAETKPETAAPQLRVEASGRGRTGSLECATEGASLGWRRKGDRTWQLATTPFELPTEACEIELLAHRIGYRPARATTKLEALAPDDRPHLVLLMADDMAWNDLGVTGHAIHQTPHLDALAASGTRFVQAYSACANCAPTRAALLSGRSAPHTRVFTVGSPARGKKALRKLIPTPNERELEGSVRTLAEVLRDAGYHTGHFGKWHLGESDTTGPLAQGFDHNIAGGMAGHPKSYFSPYKNRWIEDGPEGEYLTTRLVSELISWTGSLDRSKPFFAYLPFYSVHTPVSAPEADIARVRARHPELSKRALRYAAMVERLDAEVGRLVEHLQSLEDREVVIVFTSDNGGHASYADPSPLRGSKGMFYEGGIRVPFFVSGPSIPEGRTVESSTVHTLDLFPTFANYAGADLRPETRDVLEGANLRDVFEGRSEGPERALVWHFPAYLQAYGGMKDPFRTRPVCVLRDGRYKLFEWFEDGRLELYDLEADPFETKDLAEQIPELRDRLHQQMLAWRAEHRAPVPTELNPDWQGQ